MEVKFPEPFISTMISLVRASFLVPVHENMKTFRIANTITVNPYGVYLFIFYFPTAKWPISRGHEQLCSFQIPAEVSCHQRIHYIARDHLRRTQHPYRNVQWQ